jgi:truncated hemoglobin YjbI
MVAKVDNENLYERIGGRATLEKVHKIFYDKIYAHPWIGQYFQNIQQDVIEIQQTEFMSQAMGGPAMYCGKLPIPAHKHMFITENLFELRTQLLKDSLNESRVSLADQQAWLKIDQAFKKGIVKSNISDCQLRFQTDDILDFKDPTKKPA